MSDHKNLVMDAFYVFASSKPWHTTAFERLREEVVGRWALVSSPAELAETIAKNAPRYIFFLHWNWRVPQEIWSRYECVCFHMTDVPYGRGGSPLQNLIKNGHKETKLSALRMVEHMDAGPVYTKLPLSLDGRAEDIYLRAGDLSVNIIRWILEVHPTPVPQQGVPSLFKRRRPSESQLPEVGSIEAMFDHIRMLDAPSYPLAFLDYGEFRLEFTHAQLKDNEIEARVVFRKQSMDGN